MQDSDSRTSLAGDHLSNNLLYRTAELEASGRTIYGIAVPYQQVVEINMGGPQWDFMEMFVQGAFARSIVERGNKVKLLTSHNRHKLAIGKAVTLREDPAGLYTEFQVASTRDGDEALELVQSGTVDSFSIGFRPIQERRDNGVHVITEAALFEVSLVNFPAYPGALVGGVRSQLVIPHAVAERRLRALEFS